MQATARRLSVVSATSTPRRRLIRGVRPTLHALPVSEDESGTYSQSSGPPERPWVVRPHSQTLPDTPQQWYRIYPAIFAPALLALAALVAALVVSWWWLAAVPFIWLGSICAQPNLNLADGCLTYLSVGAALIVLRFHPPLGHAIWVGAVTGYAFAFAEKMIRMRPVTEDDK
jgi:hypothetical protein